MKDMKLKELLPVGKIEPRKPIKELLDIHEEQGGVMVAIDDYNDVLFVAGKGFDRSKLKPYIELISHNYGFKEAVIAYSNHAIRGVTLTQNGLGVKATPMNK